MGVGAEIALGFGHGARENGIGEYISRSDMFGSAGRRQGAHARIDSSAIAQADTEKPVPLHPDLHATMSLRLLTKTRAESESTVIAPVPVLHRLISQFPTTLPCVPDGLMGPVLNFLDKEGVKQFHIDSMIFTGARITFNGLNLLGQRMQKYPRAQVRIVSVRSETESEERAIAQAVVARTYLSELWGIDSSRITVATTSADSAHVFPPVLLLQSDDRRTLFAPIEYSWTAQELRVPRLSLKPASISGTGVARWETIVHNQHRLIARRLNPGLTELGALELLPDKEDSSIASLVAELRVYDSTRNSIRVFDTLRLHLAPPGAPAPASSPRLMMQVWINCESRALDDSTSDARMLLDQVLPLIQDTDFVSLEGKTGAPFGVQKILAVEMNRRHLHLWGYNIQTGLRMDRSSAPDIDVVTITIVR